MHAYARIVDKGSASLLRKRVELHYEIKVAFFFLCDEAISFNCNCRYQPIRILRQRTSPNSAISEPKDQCLPMILKIDHWIRKRMFISRSYVVPRSQ